MSKYIGPKCRLSRREKTDLYLKSGIRPLESKCNINSTPGVHGNKKSRFSNYGSQLREKQKVKRLYNILEKQFLKYYKEAARRKGSTGSILLQILESRLDNLVYRMGFASTRAEARQLTVHKSILVNNKLVNIPSYILKQGDIITICKKSQKQVRIIRSLELFKKRVPITWIEIDEKKFQGVFKRLPERSDLYSDINEQLIVELYSK